MMMTYIVIIIFQLRTIYWSKTNAEGINIGHYFWKEKEYPFANIKRTEIPPKIPCKNISVYDMLLGPHIGPTGYFFFKG